MIQLAKNDDVFGMIMIHNDDGAITFVILLSRFRDGNFRNCSEMIKP